MVVGVVYSLAGVAFIVYGLRRVRSVDDAIRRGEYLAPGDPIVMGFTAVGVVLGLLTVCLVIWQP